MKIEILEEAGYISALRGICLSRGATMARAAEIAPHLAFGIPGERSFLEMIHVTFNVIAPRYWWQEADRYRLSAKLSASTMYTLTKKPLTQEDFEHLIVQSTLEFLNIIIKEFKEETDRDRRKMLFGLLKANLPEGYLQERIWKMPYNALQNIYTQRFNHRLPEWRYFCEYVIEHAEHPEFIRRLN